MLTFYFLTCLLELWTKKLFAVSFSLFGGERYARRMLKIEMGLIILKEIKRLTQLAQADENAQLVMLVAWSTGSAVCE